MGTPLSYWVLRQQNATFRNTGGVSQGNRDAEFNPAFYDTQHRTADIARLRDGTAALLPVRDARFHLNRRKTLAVEVRDVMDGDRTLFLEFKRRW